jgi:hypothetical protein
VTTKCSCGKPTSGGAWCTGSRSCTHTVDVAIAHIAAYYDDLDTIRTRQTSYGGLAAKGSIGKAQALGVDARFLPDGIGTLAVHATRNAVTTYARVLHDDRPELGWPKHDTVHSVCNHFASNLAAIAALPWADEFKAEMLSVERMLTKIIDRPADRWYAGRCGAVMGTEHNGSTCACACHHGHPRTCDIDGGCGREYDNVPCPALLYAEPDNPFVRCKVCGTTHTVAERRADLLSEAEDREATVETITRIITTLGDRDVRSAKVSARIRQWAIRGKIESHGLRVVDGRPRPVYRVGDVLDLLNDQG